MRIQCINNVISGIRKTARNTVAAGFVAASPMVAKAEAIVPRQFAKTNTVELVSWAKQWEQLGYDWKLMSIIPSSDGFKVKTNEVARFVKADIEYIGNGKVKIGGVGDGNVVSAQLLATDDLKKPISEWDIVDFLGKEGGSPYVENSATKWSTEFDATAKQRFFKWRIHPELKRENGDAGINVIYTDEKGQILSNYP